MQDGTQIDDFFKIFFGFLLFYASNTLIRIVCSILRKWHFRYWIIDIEHVLWLICTEHIRPNNYRAEIGDQHSAG